MPPRHALPAALLLVGALVLTGCGALVSAVAMEGATQAARTATGRVAGAPAGPLCTVTDFGAVGDGQTLNTGAFQRAFDACAERGGGTVWVPAGTFVTGPVRLRSRVTLHLDAGAVLLGATGRERPPTAAPSLTRPWDAVGAALPGAATRVQDEHRLDGPVATLLYGEGLEEVAITGNGVIGGHASFLRRDDVPAGEGWVRLSGVRGLTVRDVTFRGAVGPTLVVERGERVLVDGVTIDNPDGGAEAHGVVLRGVRGATLAAVNADVGGQAVLLADVPGYASAEVTLRSLDLAAPGGVQLGGAPGQPVAELAIEGLRLRVRGPAREGPALFGVAYVQGLRARDVRVQAAAATDQRPALFLEGTTDVTIDGLELAAAEERPAAVRLTDVRGLTVRAARAEGFAVFLDGAGTLDDLAVLSSDLRRVGQAWRLPDGITVRQQGNLHRDPPAPIEIDWNGAF